MGRFDGQVAVVTGAGSGIGAATACRFAQEGAKVVLADIDGSRLEALKMPGECLRVVTDTADPASVERLVQSTMEHFGKVDAVVANAGIWTEREFIDISTEEWDRILRVNLRGTFLVCRDFAKAIVATKSPASIVVTASTNSFIAEPNTAHYNASKGALLMLIKSMAVDLAEAHIRVNGIAPGTIRTNISPVVMSLPEGPSPLFAFPPARRWGTPDDCAGAITFLASQDAAYITGAVLVVDGGQIALNGVVR